MTPYYDRAGITLWHGDCREVLPGLPTIGAVISDPPYGMNLDTDTTRFSGGEESSKARRGEGRAMPTVLGDDKPFDPVPWLSFPSVVLWGSNHFAASLPTGTTLVWVKRLDGAFGTFLSDAEVAWMKGGCGVYCRRDLSMYAEAKTREHPCQKPVGLMAWCIEKAKADPALPILDPYAGSGSTLLAALRMQRTAIGVELSEAYCEIAAKRLDRELAQGDLFIRREAAP